MNITILIKTFKRPEAYNRLVESIKTFYPDINILTLDDSNEDIGVSAGRNRLVEMCQTPYCLILDDDCIFTNKTDLEKALKELVEKDLDILQFETQTDFERDYHGLYEIDGSTVKMVKGSRDGLYDFCLNIFLAKTESLKKYPWDEKYKMGEHFGYFFTHRGKLRIGKIDNNVIEHHHVRNDEYNPFRERALGYVKQYMVENGINKRIDLYGKEYVI